jgi:predicted AlkP superfamily phosphohydrolase/phosphomutase
LLPRPRLTAAIAVLVVISGLSERSHAWGFLAHRVVNRQAIATLPGESPLRALFEGNADYLAEHSIDPDLWRAAGREDEGPQHFLDLDAFGSFPFDGIPRVEAEHLAKHGREAVQKGRVPWRVGEVYHELVAGFRSREPGRILERAAVLGHYVGDAHVPLHAALNYDGQLTGQTGIHARWESELVERFERQILPGVRPAPARPVPDPVGFTFEVLLESYRHSLEALAADREVAGRRDFADTPQDDRYDDGYYSRLHEREASRVQARLAAAATALGSLWLSAWREAGSPPLDVSFRFPHVRRGAKLVLLSLDGAAASLIDDAVGRGVMPHLARLRARGATARGSRTTLPCKTAAGHAAVFTGAWSDRNGISGNEVAVPGGSVLEENSGYTSTHLRAEPLWVTAARQGLQVTVASATQVYPFGPFLEERRFGGNYGRSLTLFDGYQNVRVPDAVYTANDLAPTTGEGWLGELPAHLGAVRELTLIVAGSKVDGLVYDDPTDPVRGFDTLYLGLDRDPKGGITLKPAAAADEPAAFAALSLRLAGSDGAAFFRLFSLSPDGSEMLLYRSPVHVLRASRPRLEGPAFAATGGFLGNGADDQYRSGALGPPLWDGGDGTAERRYLETVALMLRQFRRLNDFAIDRTSWDLLLTYLPQPDEAFHLWLGRLDPTLPHHDPALASRLRPLLDALLGRVDAEVGHLVERAGPRAVVAVASDHGQMATDRVVRPNVALARAGLLALDDDEEGRVDLSRTRAVYFPGNSAFVLVNRAGRPSGIVRPDEEEGVRRQVRETLRALRDPEGRAPVLDVIEPRPGDQPGVGGPTGGDLYLSLAPRYRLSPATDGEAVGPVTPTGEHLTNPERPGMWAAFSVAGAGVASGVDLGLIRQIDIAPTLCALIGIDPPAQATGTALHAGLATMSAPAPAGVEAR